MRIGDTERESALAALGEHMSAGRLDIDEYGERTAKVSAAKTRGELLDLFVDLPAPHPNLGQAQATPPPPQRPAAAPQASMAPYSQGMPVAQRVMGAVVPLAFIGAAALYLTTVHFWMIFLIPVAIAIITGSIFGEDKKRRHRMARDYYRQQEREARRRDRDEW